MECTEAIELLGIFLAAYGLGWLFGAYLLDKLS